jgi:hypothetical protein
VPTPASAPARPPADLFADAVYPQPGSAAESLRPAPRVGIPLDNDEFGIDCRVCGTRLHVRRSQIGDTVKCPDCHTPLVVKAPPIRKQAQPTDYEEAELFKLSEPVELPVMTYESLEKQSEGAVSATPVGAASPNVAKITASGVTAMQNAARALLEKARIQQEQEEAEEREHSAERFTQGLLAFFADPQALIRLGILAVWFEVAMTLFRWALGIRVSEDAPAVLAETTSLVAMAALVVVGLGFLYAAAACGLALVQDSSNGLRRIENWPRANFLTWGRDVFYIINAWFLAALPGALVGILLGLAGIKGAVLFTAAASFAGLFPPILLSMLESNSALAPVNNEVWVSIRERPDPWRLTYLITTIVTIGGLTALVVSLVSGFLVGLLGAAAMVACMMFYFRTVGWLICFLAGRDKGVAA